MTHELDFCTQQHDLVPGGAAVAVTGANREDFVRAYVRFLLEERIAPQAKAFCAGFRRVCDSDVLQMFNGAELERVVCGCAPPPPCFRSASCLPLVSPELYVLRHGRGSICSM